MTSVSDLGRHPGHGDGRVRLLVRLHVQPQPDLLARLRHRELPELVVVVTGRRVIPQLEHQLDHVGRQAAVLTLFWVHLEQLEVAGKAPGADAEVEASLRHVVELRDALGQHQRVVVRETGDARTELDLLGATKRVGNKQVRCRDILPDRRKVLTDPGFVKPQLVQGDDLLQVRFDRLREVRAGGMQRHCEVPVLHTTLLLKLLTGGCAPRRLPAGAGARYCT